MDGLCLKTRIHVVAPSILVNGSSEFRSNVSQVNAVGRSCFANRPPQRTSLAFSRFLFKHPFKSLWPGHGGNSRYNGMALDDAVSIDKKEETEVILPEEESAGTDSDGRNGSWVLKIMDVRSLWSEGEQKNRDRDEEEGNAGENNGFELEKNGDDGKDCENCIVFDDEEEDDVEFDRGSFSRLLRRVSLAEARLYSRMSYLGSLAYTIPKIKSGNLLENLGLRFITSSLEKREMDIKAEESRAAESKSDSEEKPENEKNDSIQKSLSTAYDVTASAASYLHSQTKSLLPYKFTKDKTSEDSSAAERQGNEDLMNSEMASLMATTESVTAAVAAKEEVKQAVADNLKSSCSSPCEWFICDNDQSGTRFFVIQGSESLASWQANLLFEPIQFEGLDVVVHRGIYEAAKGIYEQMLPEVHAHLKSHGTRATFRFTGHSLGGSLALLINLMLLIRLEAPISSLLPVIMFGAPSIMCGGDVLLRKLGLPRSHVQAVALHRDIVPRAFSCKYPSHVAKLLKALNGNFRNHPCLNSRKLLYVPMGELLILQPDKNFSPNHHLLPPGSGLYILDCPLSENTNAEKLLQAAQMVFLNSPHPLEILRDRSAYGFEGTIHRDHDMESYLKSIREVIRQELHQIKKAKREHRLRIFRQPLAGQSNAKSTIAVGSEAKFNFSGVVQRGRESLKRFSRLVASQHMHLSVVLLFPARFLLLGEFSSIV